MEADGVELGVTGPAVLMQSDADAAGARALGDREGEAGVGGVRGKVPAAPRRLAGSPGAPQLHGPPLPRRQGCSGAGVLGHCPDGTAKKTNMGRRWQQVPGGLSPHVDTCQPQRERAQILPWKGLWSSRGCGLRESAALHGSSHLRETRPVEKTRSRNSPGASFRKVLGTAR